MNIIRKMVIALLAISASQLAVAANTNLYDQIYHQITSLQVQSTTPLVLNQVNNNIVSWHKQKGLFESWVHMNVVGGPVQSFIRNNAAIFDNNFFVTAWTLETLSSAYDFNAIHLDQSVLNNAIQAENTFLDKNHPGSSLMSFWPQKKVGQYWQAAPKNLDVVINDGSVFVDIVKAVCHELPVKYKNECDAALQKMPLFNNIQDLKAAFNIPSDVDDTSVNFALGAMLYAHKNDIVFRNAYHLWKKHNSPATVKRALQTILHYAYEPLSADLSAKLIDPRSYYVMHQYLEQMQGVDPLLPTTWLLNLYDEQQELAGANSMPPIAMPFNLNNVDASVLGNFIYGIVSLDKMGWLTKSVDGDPLLAMGIHKLLNDSASYLVWVVEHDLALKRPDITMLYYPPKYNLYWFMARTLSSLKTYHSTNSSIQAVQQQFQTVLETSGTSALLKTATIDGTAIYWDDFLGDADHRFLSKRMEADDRLYSTAVVLNALIDTWTIPNNHSLVWQKNTPRKVKETISQSIYWLKTHIMGIDYAKENAFFSGSVKGENSLPFYYPATIFQHIDGTPMKERNNPKQLGDPTLVIGVNGIVNSTAYQHMIEQQHFGQATPVNFKGFNKSVIPFPYWSAPVLTYSFALDAIVKFDHITP